MTEEQVKEAIRGFLKAMAAGDVKQAVSFMATDVIWTEPNGVHKGQAEVGTYVEKIKKIVQEYQVTETGIGIVVQGNTGIIEHNLAGVTDGKKWGIPAMCIYEFQNDKMQNIRTFYDRLSQAKQVAGGIIAKTAINSVINAMEKQLR
jgi:ketosteroid isomerase-like protein